MPLVIQFTGPYAAPKILCDHCGEEITEAKDGNYQWTHQDGCADGQTALGWGWRWDLPWGVEEPIVAVGAVYVGRETL